MRDLTTIELDAINGGANGEGKTRAAAAIAVVAVAALGYVILTTPSTPPEITVVLVNDPDTTATPAIQATTTTN